MKSIRMARTLGVVLACGLILIGCGRGADEHGGKDPSFTPDEVSRLETSKLRVEVKGATSFTYEQEVELRIVAINKPGVETHFLSVGIHDMKTLQPGETFRVAFDLVGPYRGPGKYKLPAVSMPTTNTTATPTEAPETSRPYLTYLRTKSGPDGPPGAVDFGGSFDYALEPCALEVGAGEHSGRLRCPKVADASGAIVSLDMTWRQV